MVYALGATGRSARAAPVNLALAGAAVAALFVALTSAVIVVDAHTLNEFRFWVVGSVAGRDLDVLAIALPFIAVGLVIALLAGRASTRSRSAMTWPRALGERVAPRGLPWSRRSSCWPAAPWRWRGRSASWG